MADLAAAAALAPFEAGVREAWAYRSFLADRLDAEERYALDVQRVLDVHHPPSPGGKDGDSGLARKGGRGKKGNSAVGVAHTGHVGRAWTAMARADKYEAAARVKRVGIVRSEALAKLDTWCRAQDRALENLRGNLSASVRTYLDARNKAVPAAQHAYEKRCAELDDLIRQETAVKLQRELLADRAPHHSQTLSHTHMPAPAPGATSGSAASITTKVSGLTTGAGTGSASPLNTSSSYPDDGGDAPTAPDKDKDRDTDKENQADTAGTVEGTPVLPHPADPSPRPFPRLLESLALRSKDKDKESGASGGGGKSRSNLFSRRARVSGSGSGPGPGTDGSGHGSGVTPEPHGVTGYTPDPAGIEVLLRKKARVQREAEELDGAYRREVIRLETLRLSVVHFLKMAQEQCLAHRSEMGTQLVAAWVADETQSRLLDDAVRAYRTQAQHDAWIHRNNVQKDVTMVQNQIPSLQVTTVPYHNQYVSTFFLRPPRAPHGRARAGS